MRGGPVRKWKPPPQQHMGLQHTTIAHFFKTASLHRKAGAAAILKRVPGPSDNRPRTIQILLPAPVFFCLSTKPTWTKPPDSPSQD